MKACVRMQASEAAAGVLGGMARRSGFDGMRSHRPSRNSGHELIQRHKCRSCTRDHAGCCWHAGAAGTAQSPPASVATRRAALRPRVCRVTRRPDGPRRFASGRLRPQVQCCRQCVRLRGSRCAVRARVRGFTSRCQLSRQRIRHRSSWPIRCLLSFEHLPCAFSAWKRTDSPRAAGSRPPEQQHLTMSALRVRRPACLPSRPCNACCSAS